MGYTLQEEHLRIIARVSLCASTDASRFQLNGVFLDSKHKTCCGTNGKMLAIGDLHDLEDFSEDFLIPPEALEDIRRLCNAKRSLKGWGNLAKIWADVTDYGIPTITIKTLDAEKAYRHLEGAFPQYFESLRPTAEKLRTRPQRINAEMLLVAQKVLESEIPLAVQDFVSDSPQHPAWRANHDVCMAIMPLLCEKNAEEREKSELGNRASVDSFFESIARFSV